MTPKVSIIVPVYNEELYLSECLDSILNQTFKEIEVICINDGSTDASLSILEEYKKKDLRIKIFTKENQGLGSARNTGINSAIAPFLMFVDSDDTIEKNMVEILYTVAFEQSKDIVICDFKYVKNGSITSSGQNLGQYSNYNKIIEGLISFSISPSFCLCIYRKILFIKNKINFKDTIFYEDLELHFKVFLLTKSIKIIDLPLYNYHHRTGSITNKITIKNIADMFQVIILTKNDLISRGIFKKYKESYLKRLYKGTRILLQDMHINKEEYKTNNLKYLWKNLDESNLINELNIEHKIHLAYLSLLIDKTVFKVKNAKKPVGEQVLKKLAVYICSDIGLMQGAFDYIIKNKITSLYIYGAGEILSSISNELQRNNILVKGIIDQKEKEVNLLGNKYKTKKLTSTPLNESDYILVTSIASVDEIHNRISKHGKSLGFNIKTVTWHKIFNINNTQYNDHESNY